MIMQDNRSGMTFMIITMVIFAIQDGISRHLATEYNVLMIVMIRYWFFAAFVIALAYRQAGSIRAAAATKQPIVQAFRGVLLAAEVCVMVLAFVQLGLVESHAIFASYPLIVAALSGPILGEKVGRARWMAIFLGFCGVIIILRPQETIFAPTAFIPLASAMMFALYALLNRYVARQDSPATSFFWTGTAGAILMTIIGIWYWEPMTQPDWGWMIALCITGAAGHYTLIKAYALSEASAIQPFAYFQLVFASLIGIWIFGETLSPQVMLGAFIVIFAGIFTLKYSKS
jgi:drug/metabolite transporter (DMT)-like permease